MRHDFSSLQSFALASTLVTAWMTAACGSGEPVLPADFGPGGSAGQAGVDSGSPGSGGAQPWTAGSNAPGGSSAGAGSVGSGGAAGSGAGGGGGSGGSTGTGGTTKSACSSSLVGWATQNGGTTGGGSAAVATATSVSQLNSLASDSTARVIQVSGDLGSGTVNVGSNKTILAACGAVATMRGHLQMSGSANVIIRNLKVVGYNCTDSPKDCSAGADAITVNNGAHNLWFDHDDISDGSDGNLDITQASDYVTISWTKFSYSGRRTDPAGASGGHQFSNLIGASDTATGDQGHLRVTFHHVWWADNVYERMPRTRFGQIHLFNNLYSSQGNLYCIGVGVGVNIRDENNVFLNVHDPIDTGFSDSSSIIRSSGNLLQGTGGSSSDMGGTAFTPPYDYTLDPASAVASAVQTGAGTQ